MNAPAKASDTVLERTRVREVTGIFRNTPVTALLIEGCIDASRVEIVDIRSAPATWYSERSLRADAFGVDRGVQTKSKN